MSVQIPVDRNQISAFCRKHHIQKFSFFGSVLRNDFHPESDVDVLVEFAPGQAPGFIELYELEQHLSALLGGRSIDLVTEKFLNRRIRNRILSEAQVQYAEG